MYTDYCNSVDKEILEHNRQTRLNAWMLRGAAVLCLTVMAVCGWAAFKLF